MSTKCCSKKDEHASPSRFALASFDSRVAESAISISCVARSIASATGNAADCANAAAAAAPTGAIPNPAPPPNDAARHGCPALTQSSRAASTIPPRTKRQQARHSLASASAFVGCVALFVFIGPSGSKALLRDSPRPSDVARASSARAVSTRDTSFLPNASNAASDEREKLFPPELLPPESLSASSTPTPNDSRKSAARWFPSSHATTRFKRKVTGSFNSSLAHARTRADSGAGSGFRFGDDDKNALAGSPPSSWRFAIASLAFFSINAFRRSESRPSPRRNQQRLQDVASASSASASCDSASAADARVTHKLISRSSAARTRQADSKTAGDSADAKQPERTSATISPKTTSSVRDDELSSCVSACASSSVPSVTSSVRSPGPISAVAETENGVGRRCV
mmetsp:Transcript_11801/g.43884  ORF Transcript_11801/g.43884 Transcript_11801/m.43884 type:complete len:399 (-) Transcript_11801:389-1585(-)